VAARSVHRARPAAAVGAPGTPLVRLLPVLVLALLATVLAAGGRPARPLPPLPADAARELDGQVADPVRVRIPVIGVDAPVAPLDVDANGVLPVPAADSVAGWWRAGPEPGERGAAVLAGHVDSRSGPAVFFRLRELPANAEVFVDRADGSTAVFAVRRIEEHGKESFPTDSVYGRTARSELRLVTCGGAFDRAHGRYRDNVIVFASRLR